MRIGDQIPNMRDSMVDLPTRNPGDRYHVLPEIEIKGEGPARWPWLLAAAAVLYLWSR